ncbi:TKL protein kinase [Phytophthora cinnamomi]|uniref:TKL protein kinase n=1 Tax=Phytophthora cinnamomi TaxID=4785 RepID=UPI00355AB409|nr:TKL protein kinase [Phytophthora cinnamomi]
MTDTTPPPPPPRANKTANKKHRNPRAMRRWLEGGEAEAQIDDVLDLTASSSSSSSGSSGSSSSSALSSGNSSGASESSDDRALELWLSISIPLILLLAFAVVMFFCCKRQKRKQLQDGTDLESGVAAMPNYQHISRRKGGPGACATLTKEDEEALTSWRIDAENIAPIRPLGAGAYGTVWLATYMGDTVVVKKLSPPMPAALPRTKSWRKTSRHSRLSLGNTVVTNASTTRTRSKSKSKGSPVRNAMKRFVAEIRFLAALNHPKIVAFYGVAWSTPSKLESSGGASGNASDLQMVLEFMSAGDLRQYLARTRSDVRARAWGSRKLSMALDIAEALAYLHSRQPKPVLHRDLKSRNVLLDSTYTAKVADFGVSRYGIAHSSEGEDDDEDPVEQFAMTGSIGTNRWIAPEVLSGDAQYSTAVDVYSFGVILSELDSHELPFSEVTLSNGKPLPESAVLELLRTGAINPSLSDRCPRGIAMLMHECLTLEPTLRPTAAQVADRLRAMLERERRVSDIGDDVSISDQNSFLGTREDLASVYSSSIASSSMSIERGFNYAVLEER